MKGIPVTWKTCETFHVKVPADIFALVVLEERFADDLERRGIAGNFGLVETVLWGIAVDLLQNLCRKAKQLADRPVAADVLCTDGFVGKTETEDALQRHCATQ